ncbi:MAG: hypothetical protein KDD63_14250 [Bacteroidetes bacterium]|nr:hypothetical protein [Bacteroidota bacterium]MCB0853382.1 hypothetical protein [Bacteroidota bacterium]
MNIISKIIVGIMAVALMSSCVDDFQDANPPRAFDSPYFVLNVNQTAILSDQTTELTLSVVDAPGKIEAVEFSLGDDAGTVTLDQASLDGAKGQETGSIKATYNPPQNNEGTFTIQVTLLDGQGDRQKSHQESVDILVNHACTGQGLAGTYSAESCDDSVKQVVVTEASGGFEVSDLTAGNFGAGFDVAAVLVCDGGLLTASAVSKDTFDFSGISGEVDPDGSIHLEWTVTTPNTDPVGCSTDLLLP